MVLIPRDRFAAGHNKGQNHIMGGIVSGAFNAAGRCANGGRFRLGGAIPEPDIIEPPCLAHSSHYDDLLGLLVKEQVGSGTRSEWCR